MTQLDDTTIRGYGSKTTQFALYALIGFGVLTILSFMDIFAQEILYMTVLLAVLFAVQISFSLSTRAQVRLIAVSFIAAAVMFVAIMVSLGISDTESASEWSSTQNALLVIFLIVLAPIPVLIAAKLIKLILNIPKEARLSQSDLVRSLSPQSTNSVLLPPSQVAPRILDISEVEAYAFALSGQDAQVVVRNNSSSLLPNPFSKKSAISIMSIPLGIETPHIFIDGKSSTEGIIATTIAQYDENQRINMDARFDDFFDVYIPQGSSAIALNLFDPTMLEKVQSYSNSYDFELYKGRLFVSTSEDIRLDSSRFEALAGVVLDMAQAIQARKTSWNTFEATSEQYVTELVINGNSSRIRFRDEGYLHMSLFALKWMKLLLPLLLLALVANFGLRIIYGFTETADTGDVLQQAVNISRMNEVVVYILYPLILVMLIDLLARVLFERRHNI